MAQSNKLMSYWGSYLFGILLIIVVSIRFIILYSGQNSLITALAAMAIYALLYILEPILSARVRWPWTVYFMIQTVMVLVLSSLRPYLDMSGTLFVPLGVQAARSLSRKAALGWNVLYIVLLSGSMILGAGLAFGVVIGLLIAAIGIFMVSYDLLYAQAQADWAESQEYLERLQETYQKLQESASQAEELVAANERNRLARELHDSVGQAIFSATLIARSAQLYLEKDSSQVSEQLDGLQELTSAALSQLRSLIVQMRPQE